MPIELKYGRGETIRMDLPPDSILADFSHPRGVPLDDPAAAVAAAVSDPIGFPRLQDSTIPGDQVAIAVDRGVPQTPAVVAGLVQTLLEGGAAAADIEVVLASRDARTIEEVRSMLPIAAHDELRISTHDPADQSSMAYLAASKEAKPIYFHRQIAEADVVLPVSVLRLEESWGYAGVHGGLYPTFSDEATQQRFRAPSNADWTALRRRRLEEAEEAAWLLGVQFTVQVMPGPGDSVLQVLAGDGVAVANRGRELCERVWRYQSPRRANLVVATIEGGPEQQTWENLGRALFTASQAVADGGAIVLCTNLSARPGPALQRLMGADDLESLMHELRRERSSDATTATLLAETRERVQVYLLSELDSSAVEDMGVGFVRGTEEVVRLSRQYASCILLGNAHHAVVAAEN